MDIRIITYFYQSEYFGTLMQNFHMNIHKRITLDMNFKEYRFFFAGTMTSKNSQINAKFRPSHEIFQLKRLLKNLDMHA